MEFERRLEKAIERGHRRGEAEAQAQRRAAMTEEDLRRLHAQYRLELSDHVESCLSKLADHFPGFRFETIVDERGWGARVRRDDVALREGRRDTHFSLLEMVVRPLGPYHVLELAAKGTIRNKEVFKRTHFEELGEADPTSFQELIDLWVLEYAELFAAEP